MDSLTGDTIEAAKPVFSFFNQDTQAHLYTIELRERDYILDNLDNYSFEGTAYYAFADELEAIDTVPVYRLLNNQTGSHLFTSDRSEFDYVKDNLSHFAVEADNGIAFHVVEV